MPASILTLNAGSSSLKFALYGAADTPVLVARGEVERLGTAPRLKVKEATGSVLAEAELPAGATHADALAAALASLAPLLDRRPVAAVGHRIAHGGAEFPAPIVLDDAVIAELAAYVPFAPTHQPHNLAAVAAAREAFPAAVHVACFDTAFHQGKEFVHDTYGLPRRLYDEGVRRYGHHGLSYDYIAGWLREEEPGLAGGRVIVAHLGSGASMCALRNGRSVESTMGFSALDGLPMGTRCGALDPGIVLWLQRVRGMSPDAIETMLTKDSGLKGLSGISNDVRELEASGTPAADEAIGYFAAMVRREIGAMAATLGGLDAVVFTAGIGEHSATVRRRILAPLGWLGIHLDEEANSRSARRISAEGSPVAALIVPTDEEIVIARASLTELAAREPA
jgi:acetate kinase